MFKWEISTRQRTWVVCVLNWKSGMLWICQKYFVLQISCFFFLTMSYLIKHRSLSLHCDLLASKIQLNSEKKFFKRLFLFLHIHMHTSFHTWLTSSRNYNKLLTTLGKSRNFIILAPHSGDTSSSALLWGDWDLSYSKSLWQLHIISQWQWDKVSFRGHTITHSFLLPRQIRGPEP